MRYRPSLRTAVAMGMAVAGVIATTGLMAASGLIAAPVAVTLASSARALADPDAAAPVTAIIVDKSDRTLSLLSNGRAVRTYRNIRLGDAPIGHKRFQGDERTPEGTYRIAGHNAGSRYHLSLRISYPNAADRAYAARMKRDPGGDIFIHGQPNGWAGGTIPTDWTDGCIALSNAEIDEVFRRVRDGTPITIRP